MSKNIKPMRSGNIAFALQLASNQCSPDQFLRELTQNAIEAIGNRPDGRIVWGFDVRDGVRKLCIEDNGCGMTGLEMVQYINTYSSSSHEQHIEGNYGVGAKVTAIVNNPYGVEYVSRPDHGDRRATFVLLMAKEGEDYGLVPWRDESGSEDYGELTDEDTPEHIRTCGTRVVLLGRDASSDTAAGPEGQWINDYLNKRYFTLPENITIQCQDTGKTDQTSALRPVRGQKWLLDGFALHKGYKQLSTARVFWWIMPTDMDARHRDEDTKLKSATTHERKGHVALLHQGELYHQRNGHANRAMLQRFGIINGTNQVVLYVEPTSGLVLTDVSRSRIQVDRADPPWDEWATEFRDDMPPELQKFIDSFVPERPSKENEWLRKKAQELLTLYNLMRYQPQKTGPVEADKDSAITLPLPDLPTPHNIDANPASERHRPRRLFSNVKPGGPRARPLSELDIPRIDWLAGPQAEGLSEGILAHCVPTGAEENPQIVQANEQAWPFRAVVEYFSEQYKHHPSAVALIRNAVKQRFELAIIDVILGAIAMRRFWGSPDVKQLVENDKMLTMALLQKASMTEVLNRDIHREIKQTLGLDRSIQAPAG
jgi:hypothetical protein